MFAANAFALIGLRSLYFLLVGLMDKFVYLSEGLAFILAFIGVKMLLIDLWHVPIWLSLAVIVLTLVVTALLSLRADRKKAACGSVICTCSCVQGWPDATWKRSAARFITTDATVTTCSAHGRLSSRWRQTPFGCPAWERSASSSGALRTTPSRGTVLDGVHRVVAALGRLEEVVGVRADRSRGARSRRRVRARPSRRRRAGRPSPPRRR